MGMASACPLVTSTVRSAQLCRQNSSSASRPKHDNCLFIWLEPNDDVLIEQGRIRRLRQGRCTIHRIFYRLAHRRVAVALRDARAGHLPARDLRELDLTIEAHAGRRRLDPRSLDSIANSRDIAVARWAGFDGAAMFLVGQLLAQFSFPVLTGAIIRRAFGIGDLLCLRRLLCVRGLLGLGSLPSVGRAFRCAADRPPRGALCGAVPGFPGVRNALLPPWPLPRPRRLGAVSILRALASSAVLVSCAAWPFRGFGGGRSPRHSARATSCSARSCTACSLVNSPPPHRWAAVRPGWFPIDGNQRGDHQPPHQ